MSTDLDIMSTNIADAEAEAAEKSARRAEIIAGLRELADFLDAHPRIEAQVQTYNVYCSTREELTAAVRGTSWTKVYRGDYFMLRKTFRGGLQLDVFINRETVCRQVVVGHRKIAAKPAEPARTEDVVEWVCDHESLLASDAEPSGS